MDGRFLPPEEAAVSLADPDLQAGLGVFETLAVRSGRVLDWEAHWRRLEDTLHRLRGAVPEASAVREAASSLAAEVPEGYGWIKVIVLRRGRCVVFWGEMDPADEERPSTAVILPYRRSARHPLAGLKTLNYADFVLGLEEARRRGADEGLWLNQRGHLTEGCTSSLFVVRRRRVYTPGIADGILPGVTRTQALEAARALGLDVHEGKLRVGRLLEADEAFLTSSLKGVRPLVAVDGRPVGRRGEPGPWTLRIQAEVRKRRGFETKQAPGGAEVSP